MSTSNSRDGSQSPNPSTPTASGCSKSPSTAGKSDRQHETTPIALDSTGSTANAAQNDCRPENNSPAENNTRPPNIWSRARSIWISRGSGNVVTQRGSGNYCSIDGKENVTTQEGEGNKSVTIGEGNFTSQVSFNTDDSKKMVEILEEYYRQTGHPSLNEPPEPRLVATSDTGNEIWEVPLMLDLGPPTRRPPLAVRPRPASSSFLLPPTTYDPNSPTALVPRRSATTSAMTSNSRFRQRLPTTFEDSSAKDEGDASRSQDPRSPSTPEPPNAFYSNISSRTLNLLSGTGQRAKEIREASLSPTTPARFKSVKE
ncbi:hypothetical protein B0T17DRAFT_642246 [Bombardia bombarda]|uniref:Uncharacterized protein n=1 Tax=Bombardia bombarda TaxID=252184 RepID=A0AA39WUP7_9PEZI|nr:hypothetical protein B0T17DRAFT_642246 [Bombardia bombarda]